MKTKISRIFVLPLAAIAGLSLCCGAQQPAAGSAAGAAKAPVKEMHLPVAVIDKHGALVTNLSANDLTLMVDGRQQKIESLSAQNSLPYRLGLLVETSHAIYPAMESERKALAKFLDQMQIASGGSAPVNQAFLIHFDREVELLEDFTGARDKLNREIDELSPTSRQQSEPQGPESSGDDRGYGGQPRRRSDNQLYDAIYLASNELMKPVEGRKSLIVLSDGVDHGSKETLNDAIDAADRAGVQIYTIYLRGQEERTGSEFPGSGRHGGLGGGYPGGGGGWPGSSGGGNNKRRDEESNVDGRKILEKIATRTGGHSFEAKKKENLEELYGLVANELHQQYVLTFVPDVTGDADEFHKVVLSATKGETTVEVPEGFYLTNGK